MQHVQPHLNIRHAQGRLCQYPQDGHGSGSRQPGMQQGLPAGGACPRRSQGWGQQDHPGDEQQPHCACLLHGCRKCSQRHQFAAMQEDQALGQRPQTKLLVQPAVQSRQFGVGEPAGKVACDTP